MDAMLRSLIRLLRDNALLSPILMAVDVVLYCIDFLAARGRRTIDERSVAVVKLDKVGDYILVRNFLRELCQHLNENGKHVTLIANKDNAVFIEALDVDVFDSVMYIDIYKYSTRLRYRFAMSRELYRRGFTRVINSTYARVLVLDDFIVRATRAQHRIGQHPHRINLKSWERRFGDACYTELLSVSDEITFEFERNRLFFEKILHSQLGHIQLHIEPRPSTNRVPFAIVAPGAGSPSRQWQSSNFAQLSDWIVQSIGLEVLICGSPAEASLGNEIVSMVQNRGKIFNAVGTMSVTELLAHYQQSEFIVCNESASVHIGAALNKRVFCVSGGSHYGKYCGYPESLQKSIQYIFPDEVDSMLATHGSDYVAQRFDISSDLDIQSIEYEKVRSAMSKALGRE